jgi:hypothetical protein
MEGSSQLLELLFDLDRPRLRQPPEQLLQTARGLSSGDYTLVKLAVDIWCEQGEIRVHELFRLEQDDFIRALRSLGHCLGIGDHTRVG